MSTSVRWRRPLLLLMLLLKLIIAAESGSLTIFDLQYRVSPIFSLFENSDTDDLRRADTIWTKVGLNIKQQKLLVFCCHVLTTVYARARVLNTIKH